MKRVKKKINDYILLNYSQLFFIVSPTNNKTQTLTRAEICQNPKLLLKAAEELRLSTESEKDPTELLLECIVELEEKGFLNLLEHTAEQYLYSIRC